MPETARVALAHDYLLVLRGAERTFAAIADEWPEAPIHTLLWDPAVCGPRLAGHPVVVSRLNRTGARQSWFRWLLPVFPLAASAMPLPADADVAVISSSAFAHGMRSAPGTATLCYCHTPFRYAWFEGERALASVPPPARPALAATLAAVRHWDVRAAARVDRYVANGRITQERIARIYGREAPIVHPPVEVERFAPGTPEGHVLVVCELVRHKRVDVALEAARRAGVAVRVVGTGADEPRLRALHGDHATFLGRVDDAQLAREYASAAALVMANVEEFGIAAVEAQAAGRPVVAADAGGARETVRDGETGVLVPPDDVDALAEALRETDLHRFDGARIAAHAQRFSATAFRRRMREEVDALVRTGGDGQR